LKIFDFAGLGVPESDGGQNTSVASGVTLTVEELSLNKSRSRRDGREIREKRRQLACWVDLQVGIRFIIIGVTVKCIRDAHEGFEVALKAVFVDEIWR
jgi:hypothetical protein